MPAFFIVAGYLYQKKLGKYENMGRGRFLLAKAKHLLVPYVFWTVLLWVGVQAANSLGGSLSQMLISIDFGPMSVKDLIIGLLTYEKYYTEHLWFLYVLFMYFLVHSLSGKAGSSLLCVIIGMAGGFLTCFLQMPNIIDRFLLWFVFFAFGRYIADKKSLENLIENKAYGCFGYIFAGFIVLSAVRLMLSVSNYGMNIYFMRLLKQTVKYAIGFTGVLLLYLISVFIEKRTSKTEYVFENIGNYSYDIYLMHNPYIVALGCTVLCSVLGVNPLSAVISATAAGIAVPMAVSNFIIRRVGFLSKIMLGR